MNWPKSTTWFYRSISEGKHALIGRHKGVFERVNDQVVKGKKALEEVINKGQAVTLTHGQCYTPSVVSLCVSDKVLVSRVPMALEARC